MLSQILAALSDCAFVFNQEEGKYTYVSSNIAELAGYSSIEFENDTNLWVSLIDDRDINKVEDVYDKPLTTDKSLTITYRITTAGGEIKWINEKRCLYKEDDGKSSLLSIIQDLQCDDGLKHKKDTSLTEYGILFDTNPNPMWIYEVPSLRFLKVNAAAVKIYGYSEAEFLTMTLKDIRPSSDQEGLLSFLANRVSAEEQYKGYSNSGTWRHQAKNGSIIYAELYGDTVPYNHYDCRLTVATNVTEKVYYQEEAKLREQFLSSLIDSQTNFLIRINMAGEYTFVNKRFMKIFGYGKEDIIGKHFSLTTTPDENYLCEEAFYNCINNPGKIIHLVHKKPDVNGVLYDTEWEFIAVTNESREVIGIQGIGQDISDKINIAKEMASAKSSLEAIINNTHDLIWSIDLEMRYLYMNQAYKHAVMAQTGIEPVTGESSLSDFFDPEMLEKWKQYYQQVFEGKSYIVENEFYDSVSGKTFCYETSFNPILNSTGEVTGAGCFSRDITERINSSKSIIEQNERLRNIASLSSHELRRPVATMLGLINIIDRENFHNPENMEIINHLLVTGNEIDDVIRLIVNKTFIRYD